MTLRTRILGTGAVSTQNVQVSWAEVSTGAPTYRAAADLDRNSWVGVPNNLSLFDDIDESTANDTDYIISGTLNGSFVIFELSSAVPQGTYVINIRARRTSTSGQVRCEIYINGISKVSAAASSNAPGGSIGIGRFGASNGFYSNANIGIFRIYNRALTPIEVQQNFNATRARFNI
jgi:hypothetical protein